VVWRHAVGNVGPTERSLILRYWQCGPAPQRPPCSSDGCSLQTAATTFVADAREPAALAAEAAAAKRSTAPIAIVILFRISQVPCWLCVGDVHVFEWMVRMVTRKHLSFRASTRRASDAPRLSRPSRIGISDSVLPCALMANRSLSRRTTIMTSSQQMALVWRPAPNRPDRTGSWIARLFSQPVVRLVSQATEWDNDVPPFPILAGEVAQAERRGSSK
jgi:hypothetical protein